MDLTDTFRQQGMGLPEDLVRKTTLENGIRVVTETMPEARSIALSCLVDASPRDEGPLQHGLAHLVEHCVFHGTTSRSATQIARLMDVAGGTMGAFTARDYTCYNATVLDEYRTYALDLLGDILLNSTFPADRLEREKDAILSEIDGRRDLPHLRVDDLLRSFAWPGHPLGRPITGFPDTVQALSRADIVYFVHEHYLPNRLIFAAAGNVEHEDFVAQVRDAFWRMLGESEPATRVQPRYRSGAVVEHAPVSQAYFALGVRAFPYAQPGRYAVHVLNSLLGGGLSSRLYRRIREQRGLVYAINSEYCSYADDGILVISGSTTPEHVVAVLGLILTELWLLLSGSEAADDEELWKAKTQIRGQHLIAGEGTHTRMSRLATQEFYFGKQITTQEILSHIEAVDNAQLKRIANEALLDALRQVTIAVVGPESPEHYSLPKIEAMLRTFD